MTAGPAAVREFRSVERSRKPANPAICHIVRQPNLESVVRTARICSEIGCPAPGYRFRHIGPVQGMDARELSRSARRPRPRLDWSDRNRRATQASEETIPAAAAHCTQRQVAKNAPRRRTAVIGVTVLPRLLVNPGGALHSTHRISTQRVCWIGILGQRLADRPGVFHRHRRALGEVRKHRVASITQQRDPVADPATRNRVVKQGQLMNVGCCAE